MKPHCLVLVLAAMALAGPPNSLAIGGTYDIDGGTAPERAQISAALDASRFDWDLVPAEIRIHVERSIASSAVPGQIWLDARLLDAGRFSWGVIQHEYAHQVDFFRLTDADRQQLLGLLGGEAWWDPPGLLLPHDELGAERFASTLAWSYWPSPDNVLAPSAPGDESAALAPARFRALMQRILDLPVPLPSVTTAPLRAPSTCRRPRRRSAAARSHRAVARDAIRTSPRPLSARNRMRQPARGRILGQTHRREGTVPKGRRCA
jgi:hypothetical protein